MDLTNDVNVNDNDNVNVNEFPDTSEVGAIKASNAAVLAGNQRRRDHIAELETKITTLAANINAAKYQWLRLLAEFDRIEGWGEYAGISSTANWLSFKCGITPNAARENVRVARALPELPLISAAFKAGRLSYSKVRAMTRAATQENEEYLVMVARHGTGAHMEKLVRLRARTLKLNDPDASQRAFESRSLDWYDDEDGTVVIRARLMADQAEVVIGVIQGIASEIQQQTAAEADTLEETLPVENRGQGTGAPPLRIGISAETHRTQLRADALERLAQWWNQNGGVEEAQTADHREYRQNETGQNKAGQSKTGKTKPGKAKPGKGKNNHPEKQHQQPNQTESAETAKTVITPWSSMSMQQTLQNQRDRFPQHQQTERPIPITQKKFPRKRCPASVVTPHSSRPSTMPMANH